MNALLPSFHECSPASAGEIMEAVLLKGDLASLTPDERVSYYTTVCQTLGIEPMMKPFAYITLNGKLTLYALKACTDQLRKKHSVSITIVSREIADDLLTVHVKAKDASGREDEDLGVVYLPASVKGEARANLILKAVTKAKRRVTLSICGLGMLDETEVEDIPAAAKREVAAEIATESRPAAPATPDPSRDDAPAPAVASREAPPQTAARGAPTRQKPGRKPKKDPNREIDPRYEAVIHSEQPRRAFDRPVDIDPDAERAIWERQEEFLRLEHEIQSIPTLGDLDRWFFDNRERVAAFSEGEMKNGLRMAYANKRLSLQPHSLAQKAMAARGLRYAQQTAPMNDGLDIPDYLKRQAAE